ncbi:MAG: Arylsulfatase A/Arylsulfatase A [Verrucomicrobia bacterium]|nr:MAG: Arylsulfatase A/Arylsulfatase A [Verrucomicrobiota bacterium]
MKLLILAFFAIFLSARAAERPNILWIISEDMSPHFGCYGETAITTPNVDRLAAEGTRFANAHVTAPICSISRSALITGMYQTSIGAHHHRSGRGTVKIRLPEDVTPVPRLFQEAGYWTCNGDWPGKGKGIAKTDYNFEWDPGLYDANDWAGRPPGKPFFAQIQLHGGKVRDGANAAKVFTEKLGRLTDPETLTLPPYYPATPALRADWALTLDACRLVDQQIGEIRSRLEGEGILDQTVVFFITDHGVSHARGKQYLYAEGTRIPCVVRGPGIPSGRVREDLVEHIDLAATSLALAGIAKPPGMQSRDVFARDYPPREAIFAARDRADETVDHLRSVRTADWLYIRNFLPKRPHLQPNNYKDHKPCSIALRQARAEGLLTPLQESLFAPERPAEELYDTRVDPWEIKNLAADPAFAKVLTEMRGRLEDWMERTADQGRQPEPEAQYDSDMAVYLGQSRKNGLRPEIEANIALMKRWAVEGK